MARRGTRVQKRSRNFLDEVVKALSDAAKFNAEEMAPPVAVVWPDEAREWELLLPLLRSRLSSLLTLGPFDVATRTGPAIWLRCMLDRAVPDAAWGEEAVPILYLPGVSRKELRAIEGCSSRLEPLAELQYRGLVWSQENGRDWSIRAFLVNDEDGLGLDVAQDEGTIEAMKRSLPMLADVGMEKLRDGQLDREFFDRLQVPDPVATLLEWLNAPKAAATRLGDSAWRAFCQTCSKRFDVDPESDGAIVAAERLGSRKGPWVDVWLRFEQAAREYPKIRDLLVRAKPQRTIDVDCTWPQDNEMEEASLLAAFQGVAKGTPPDARRRLAELEQAHGKRRAGVWARLGEAPLAQALEHLAILAEATKRPLGGADKDAMAVLYAEGGWKADLAALRALALAKDPKHRKAIVGILGAIYKPWLEASAEHLQKLALKSAIGPSDEQRDPADSLPAGACVLFADGLRFDLGQDLRERMMGRGWSIGVAAKWAAFPPVTPTAKPAVSPIATKLNRKSPGKDFCPTFAESDKALTQPRFKQELEREGIQFLDPDDTGSPDGRAWTELGSLDKAGHNEGSKMASRVSDELNQLAARVQELLDAGWKEIRIVTDHGWLLLPGKLPKVDLPKHLTETKWGRCAVLDKGAKVEFDVHPWTWNPEVRIVPASGIACFREGVEYAHGGISIQECLTPTLTVRPGTASRPQLGISSIVWTGLRCRAEVEGAEKGYCLDIRSRAADPRSSLLVGKEKAPISPGGKCALFADDAHQGEAGFVVVLAADGQVLLKQQTTIGGEEE